MYHSGVERGLQGRLHVGAEDMSEPFGHSFQFCSELKIALKKKVYFSINFLKIFIYFSFLAPLGLAVCGLSPVVVSRRNSLVSHCFS